MSDYKSVTGEGLSHIPTLATLAEIELNRCEPSLMARMEIGLKACDGIESLLNLLVESNMISTCKLAISEVIRCETCHYYYELCDINDEYLRDSSCFCSKWLPNEERGDVE